MSTSQSAPAVGSLATWGRYLLIAFTWLFTACAVVQVFLAGLGFFESGSYLADHVDFGHMIGLLTYPLIIFALVGRVGRQLVVQAALVTVLYFVQIILPTIDEGWIAALHPINAFILIGSAAGVGRETLKLVRAQRRTDVAPSSRDMSAPANTTIAS